MYGAVRVPVSSFQRRLNVACKPVERCLCLVDSLLEISSQASLSVVTERLPSPCTVAPSIECGGVRSALWRSESYRTLDFKYIRTHSQCTLYGDVEAGHAGVFFCFLWVEVGSCGGYSSPRVDHTHIERCLSRRVMGVVLCPSDSSSPLSFALDAYPSGTVFD